MTQRDLTIDDIKSAANARMFDVLSWCGIHDRPRGTYLSLRNPMRADRSASFTIWTKGGFVAWKDHATGDAGDMIDLVSYLNGWFDMPKKGRAEACRFLCERLGLEAVSREQLARDRAASKKREAELIKKSTEQLERNIGRAQKLFYDARPPIGTVTETYLRQARGIDLAALPKGPRGGARVPGAIRHIDAHEHRESGQAWPCMVACCVDFSPLLLPPGQRTPPAVKAVHRTWLAADGSGKAAVEPARKVWPGFAALVIPIWNGADGMPIAAAIDAGALETIVLTEGVEDGLSAAIADPTHRVWAIISLGNLAGVAAVLPPNCDGVIIHRQNDWLKPQAVEQFDRGKAALEATGRPVSEVRAFHGKDLNDTLRGED